MAQKVSLRFCILFTLMGAIFASVAVQAAEIVKARAGLHADKTRFVLELTGKPVFEFEKNPENGQVVIMLKNIGVPKGRVVPSATIGLVKHTMFISKGGKSSKVVLFLSKPAKVSNSFIIPGDENKAHRLVVDLIAAETL